jgi:hypothetical protein
MSHDLERDERELERSSFAQTCAYCRARFEVFVTTHADSDDQAHYACPECGKTYTAHGAFGPEVHLLARRADGKTDPYSETMF